MHQFLFSIVIAPHTRGKAHLTFFLLFVFISLPFPYRVSHRGCRVWRAWLFLRCRSFLWSSPFVCGIALRYVKCVSFLLLPLSPFFSLTLFLDVLLHPMFGEGNWLSCNCLASSFSFLSLNCSYSDFFILTFPGEASTLTFSVAKLVQAVFCKYQMPYSLNFFKNFFLSAHSQ